MRTNPFPYPDPAERVAGVVEARADARLASPDPIVAGAAAAELAIAVGQCRLLGLDTIPPVPPANATASIRGLIEFVTQAAADATTLGKRYDGTARAADQIRLVYEVLVARLDAWAGFLAINEAYQMVLDARNPALVDLSTAVDALLDATHRLDEAMLSEASLFSVANDMDLLGCWRSALAPEYAEFLPWWLDSAPEIAVWATAQNQHEALRFPADAPALAASPATLIVAPAKAMYWDEPITGRYIWTYMPDRFTGPDFPVTLAVRSNDGREDRSLDGQRLLLGRILLEVTGGWATVLSGELDAGA